MENSELENKISSVICDIVPEDSFSKISKKIAAGDIPEKNNREMKSANRFKRILFPVAAACIFVVVAVVFGFTYYGNNYAVESVIDIDVNPSIEISINKKDKVLDVVAMNEDGKAILDGMDLKKSDVKVAVNALIGSMVQKGYVVNEESGILVTVQNDDLKKAERIRSEIVTNIDKSLDKHNIKATILNQTVTDSADAKKFAEENSISVGKATFIKKLVEKDSSLVAEDLADMSIKDIVKEIKTKKIDIRDIVDYDDDGSLNEKVEDAIEDVEDDFHDKDNKKDKVDKEDKVDKPTGENKDDKHQGDIEHKDHDDDSFDMTAVKISEEDAKAKALAAAGISAEDAVFKEVELEKEKDIIFYEIEFYVGEKEYEYKINAIDGSVVEQDSENQEKPGKNPNAPAENQKPVPDKDSNQTEDAKKTMPPDRVPSAEKDRPNAAQDVKADAA